MSNRTDGEQQPRNDEMPWVARFILYLVVLLLAASMIVLPIWSVQRYGTTSGSDLWGPMLAVLIGLTTMTISGIFVFMTFRIDRGTKLKAEWTAKEIAKTTIIKIVKKVIGKKLAKTRKQIEDDLSGVPSKVSEVADDLSDKLKREVPDEVNKVVDDLSGKLKEEVAHNVNKVAEELSGKLKEEVGTKTEMAKNIIVERFDVLEVKMEKQFEGIASKIEKSFLDVDVEKLIKEAVEVHIQRDKESAAEQNGPEQNGPEQAG